MTFEEFWVDAGWHIDFIDLKPVIQEVWAAAQKAEREKYQELITAAEAVIYGWEKTMHKGPDQTADAIYRMLDVVEKIKI